MRKKISCLLIFMLVTSLLLATAGMAAVEEEPDLKLYSSIEIIEETETDIGFEEVQDIVLDMGHEGALERDTVWSYFAGFEEKVVDLEENDKTDVVTDLAANVGDIEVLEDADFEEIDAFMDEFVELDEVEDITEEIIQEVEK